jgi:hypothetical protein
MQMRSPRTVLTAVLVILTACGSPTDGSGPVVAWSAVDDGWQSGIAISALPAGFTLVTNLGNEVSVAHRFEDEDGRQLDVFRLLEPERFPAQGEVLESSDGISYQQTEGGGRREVFFETQGVRLGATSSELTVQELFAIAKSITYNPEADQVSG